MIRITASRDGFRRCNIAHTKEPKEYPDGFFSEEDLEILRKEPMLSIHEGLDDSDHIIARTPALEKMDAKKLKELCDRLEIEYPADAKKPDLIELIKANTAEPPKE